MMQSLIAWLNEYSWHQLSALAQSYMALVSVLGHSWPNFSLSLPVQSSLFTLPWAECFVSSSDQNVKEDVSNFPSGSRTTRFDPSFWSFMYSPLCSKTFFLQFFKNRRLTKKHQGVINNFRVTLVLHVSIPEFEVSCTPPFAQKYFFSNFPCGPRITRFDPSFWSFMYSPLCSKIFFQ